MAQLAFYILFPLQRRFRSVQLPRNLHDLLLTHAIHQHIGFRIHQDTWHQFVRPIIIMCQSAHGRFDASNHNRHIRIELLEDIAIGNGAIVGTHTSLPIWRIGIIRTQTFSCCIMVHHRIHTTRSHPKKQSWTSQFSKIAMVSTPVGLGYDGHPITISLQYTTYHSRTKSRVINIRIS